MPLPTYERLTGTSDPNTELVLTTPVGTNRQFRFVTVKYSAVPVHTGIVVELDSGAGAAYDVALATSGVNLQTFVFRDVGDATLAPDDAIRVTAPAGGVGITASIAIYT